MIKYYSLEQSEIGYSFQLHCLLTVLCPTDYCKNGGSCMGQNVCQCRSGYYGNQCEHTGMHVTIIVCKMYKLYNSLFIVYTASFVSTEWF